MIGQQEIPRLDSADQLLRWADSLVRSLRAGQPNVDGGLRTLPQITSNQNNYKLGAGLLFRLSSDAPRTVTGIADGTPARLISIVNAGSQNIILAHQSSSSSAANRIITDTGADVTLTPDTIVILFYDAKTQRWRVLSRGTGGGGGGGATCATAPELLCLAGRAGTANWPIITTGGDGLITGSDTAGGKLLLTANSTPGGGVPMRVERNASGYDRLLVGPGTDPTATLIPGGVLTMLASNENGNAYFGAAVAADSVPPSDSRDLSPVFFGTRSRGTFASPLPSQDGDLFFLLVGTGFDANNVLAGGSPAGSIAFRQDGAAGIGFVPGRITFEVLDSTGTAKSGALMIRSNGRVGINMGPEGAILTPPRQLSVAGDFAAGTNQTEFLVGANGNLDAVHGVPYTWPAANAVGVLTNNGAGVLTWTAAGGAPSGPAGGDLTGTYPNPTVADADLIAIRDLVATAGMLSRTGAGAFAARTLTAPAAGLTIANPTGAAGNPAFALANDLAGLEGLSGTGYARRTGVDAWTLDAAATPAAHTHVQADITDWPLTVTRGGSGANLSATGGAGQYVKQSSVGAAFTVGTVPAADVVLAAGNTQVLFNNSGVIGQSADFTWNDTTKKLTVNGVIDPFSVIVKAQGATGTGTVSVSAGSAGINGALTSFSAELQVGDTITIGGRSLHIISVGSNILATADANWPETLSGQAFTYSRPAYVWQNPSAVRLGFFAADGMLAIGATSITVANRAMLSVGGTQPAAVSTGAGQAAPRGLVVAGISGGDTADASGSNQAGAGSGFGLTSGAGGNATVAGGLGGNGGPWTLTSGVGGTVPVGAGAFAGNGGTFNFIGGAGGALTGVGSGAIAGIGADFTFTAGNGGAAPSGNTNGRGGNITFRAGLAGAGAGTVALPGVIALQDSSTRGGVIIGAAALTNQSCLLELVSTTRALRVNSMTTTQRDALTALDAMLLYNSTIPALQARVNSVWQDLTGSVTLRRTALPNATTYTVLTTDSYVAQAAALTTTATWTLPAANAVVAGRVFVFADEVGTAAAHNITISRAGSDTIDGATTTLINANFGVARLISDGTSRWTVI